jgi:Entner-Doudoroff aldolase
VTNIPGANTDGVADHAVALMLAALRQVTLGDRRVRAGNWRGQRARQHGHLTVGIVGVGRIGRAVAIRLSGFGGTVLGHDPWVPAQDLLAAGIEPVTMPELTSRSDIVSLHLPGERTIIDANWIQQAKPGVVLVNTARATLVDEPALAAALRDGRVQVYAADTIATESATGSPSPLLNLGAGTVLTEEQVSEAVEAGAEFLVSPGTQEAVVRAMLGTGVAVFSGALTPSEVMAAVQFGVDAVKIFPASLGGPAYLRSLRGPFSDVPFLPTGGVDASNLGEWLAAGAAAVGAGGKLCSPSAMAEGRWDDIEGVARQFAAALRTARGEQG